MRLKKFSSKVFLLALGLFLWGIGCSPSLFDDVVTTDNPATKKAPVFEDINQSEGSSTTAGNPGHGPSPTRDFHLNNLVYFPDDNDIVPVVGSAYGPFFPEGGQIVISEFALETSGEVSKITSDISADMPAESDLCTEEGVVCCPVDEDFKYECYLPLVDRSLSEVFVGVMDAGFNVLSSRREPVQPNLLWLGQVPKDIQVAGTDLNNDGEAQAGIGILGDQRLLQVKETGGQFKVLGEHVVEYEQVGGLSEDVPQIAFDDSGSLALRNESGGVMLYSSSFVPLTGVERFEFVDTGATTTIGTADKYTVLKRTLSNENWFGVRNVAAQSNATSSGYIYPENYSPGKPRVKIYDSSIDLNLIYEQTDSFDVAEVSGQKIGLAIFHDIDNNVFLSMGYQDLSAGVDKVSFFDPSVILEEDNLDRFSLSIITNQKGTSNSLTEKGSFAVLDKKNKKVFFEDFFSDLLGVAGGDIWKPTGLRFVYAGSDPIQFTLDSERNNMAILNSDATVYTYKVKEAGAIRRTNLISLSRKIVKLNDYVTKNIMIDPNNLSFHKSASGDRFLLVGTANLKAVLTIKLEN